MALLLNPSSKRIRTASRPCWNVKSNWKEIFLFEKSESTIQQNLCKHNFLHHGRKRNFLHTSARSCLVKGRRTKLIGFIFPGGRPMPSKFYNLLTKIKWWRSIMEIILVLLGIYQSLNEENHGSLWSDQWYSSSCKGNQVIIINFCQGIHHHLPQIYVDLWWWIHFCQEAYTQSCFHDWLTIFIILGKEKTHI